MEASEIGKPYWRMFDIEEKVAFVTGALGGIGRAYIQALFDNNVKGVALVDIDNSNGIDFIEDLKKRFGKRKVLFIQADVSVLRQLEAAYTQTINHFNQLDIVINNAGILDEKNFERTLNINLIATIRSTYLAFNNYVMKHKRGEEGVIVNTSSVVGLIPYECIPAYCISKRGVITLGTCLGTQGHYDRTKVKVVTICPGGTVTDMHNSWVNMPEELLNLSERFIKESTMQSPEFLGIGLIKIIQEGKNGSIWVCQNSEPATPIPTLDSSRVFLLSKQ